MWDDPDRATVLFHDDGWWFSGEAARRGGDSIVYLQGRTANTIVIGGVNVYVERVIGGHPAVLECAVGGGPHETWGRR